MSYPWKRHPRDKKFMLNKKSIVMINVDILFNKPMNTAQV